MISAKELVPLSLEYHDRNMEKQKKLFDTISSYEIERSDKDMERNKIIFYDKDKKKMFSSEYEIIGLYDKNYELWSWAWSIVHLNKNEVFLSRQLLNYGLDLDKTEQFLKTELITSRFRIQDPIQLEMHISLCSYLSKKPLTFRCESCGLKYEDKNVIYYLFLLVDDKDIQRFMQ